MQIKARNNVKPHFGGVLWDNLIMQIKARNNVKPHLGGHIMG